MNDLCPELLRHVLQHRLHLRFIHSSEPLDEVVDGRTRSKVLGVYPGFSTPKRKYGKYLSPCCSSEYMTRP